MSTANAAKKAPPSRGFFVDGHKPDPQKPLDKPKADPQKKKDPYQASQGAFGSSMGLGDLLSGTGQGGGGKGEGIPLGQFSVGGGKARDFKPKGFSDQGFSDLRAKRFGADFRAKHPQGIDGSLDGTVGGIKLHDVDPSNRPGAKPDIIPLRGGDQAKPVAGGKGPTRMAGGAKPAKLAIVPPTDMRRAYDPPKTPSGPLGTKTGINEDASAWDKPVKITLMVGGKPKQYAPGDPMAMMDGADVSGQPAWDYLSKR